MRVTRKYVKGPLEPKGFFINIKIVETKANEASFYSWRDMYDKKTLVMNLSYEQAKQIHAAIEKALYFE